MLGNGKAMGVDSSCNPYQLIKNTIPRKQRVSEMARESDYSWIYLAASAGSLGGTQESSLVFPASLVPPGDQLDLPEVAGCIKRLSLERSEVRVSCVSVVLMTQ